MPSRSRYLFASSWAAQFEHRDVHWCQTCPLMSLLWMLILLLTTWQQGLVARRGRTSALHLVHISSRARITCTDSSCARSQQLYRITTPAPWTKCAFSCKISPLSISVHLSHAYSGLSCPFKICGFRMTERNEVPANKRFFCCDDIVIGYIRGLL